MFACDILAGASGSSARSYVEIYNSHSGGLKVTPNGVLVIDNAERAHAGRYLCHVSNDIGQPIHTVISLTVKVPPTIKTDKAVVTVAKDRDSVKLTCIADGDRPISVKWTKVMNHRP